MAKSIPGIRVTQESVRPNLRKRRQNLRFRRRLLQSGVYAHPNPPSSSEPNRQEVMIKETFQALKPIIYAAWIVAILRLITEALTTDLNIVAMMSVYMTIWVLLLYSGITGLLDQLVWKKLFVGAGILAVCCWFVPNSIAYTVAQFQEWNHGRFYVSEEHDALSALYRDEGLGMFEAGSKATEELGVERSRTGPRAETSGGRILAGLGVGFFTSIAGFLWCAVFGSLLVGIPATMRRRKAG